MNVNQSSVLLSSEFLLDGVVCFRCEQWKTLTLFCYVPCNCQVLLICHFCIIELVIHKGYNSCFFCKRGWKHILFSDEFVPWEHSKVQNQLGRTLEELMKQNSLESSLDTLSLLLDQSDSKSFKQRLRLKVSQSFNSSIFQNKSSRNVLSDLNQDKNWNSKKKIRDKISKILQTLKIQRKRDHFIFNGKKIEFENPDFENISQLFDLLENKPIEEVGILKVKDKILTTSGRIRSKLMVSLSFKCKKMDCPIRSAQDAEAIEQDEGYASLEELNKHNFKCHDKFLCPICVRNRDSEYGLTRYLTKAEFQRHLEKGEHGRAGHKFVFHPKCHLCDMSAQTEHQKALRESNPDIEYNYFFQIYFYNVNQLKMHLETKHFKCPLCFTSPMTYYKDVEGVFKHMFECHKFVCFYKQCINKPQEAEHFELTSQTISSKKTELFEPTKVEDHFVAFNEEKHFLKHLKAKHSIHSIRQYLKILESAIKKKSPDESIPDNANFILEEIFRKYGEGVNQRISLQE